MAGSIKMNLRGEMPTFNFAEWKKEYFVIIARHWHEAIRLFLDDILQNAPMGLPVLTGSTKKSFEGIVQDYGAKPLTWMPNPNYDPKIMKKKPIYTAVFDELQLPFDGHLATWKLTVLAEPFLANEFLSPDIHEGAQFRRPQRTEPWELFLQGKAVMLEYLRYKIPEAMGGAYVKVTGGRRNLRDS